MTFDELRGLFPSAQKCVHLNHAGTAPIPQPAADAAALVADELMSDDSFAAFKNHQKRQESLRQALSRLISAPPSALAFVKNTSHGLSLVSDALPLGPGENVVVPEGEYPANVYPWMAQRARRGVETRIVPTRANGIVAEEDLIAACDAGTRVLAVSWVQWGTGQRMNLAHLGAFCRERGIFFVVDAVQGLGALRLDLSTLEDVDFAVAGCHKWLLSPAGIGVLYVRPGVMDRLLPANVGWNSVVDPLDWERVHFDLKPTADRFEEGTPNLMGTAALGASVGLLEAVGFAAVAQRVLALADYARAQLSQRGCHVVSPGDPDQCSGIVAFRHPSHSNDAVLQTLAARRIIAAVRCGSVRLSPHAYSSEADIDAAVAAL